MLCNRLIIKFYFGRVSQNLKLLNLTIPTTQQQVKKRYRQLAKQYHPDTLKQSATKQTQEHFVKLTTAYNYLKEVDEKELTAENTEEYDVGNASQEQKDKFRTKEEELRQETYEYFRRKDFYAQKKKDPVQDKPLYKTIPELFIGSAFVLILFSQWIYKTMIKTDKEFGQVKRQREDLIYENVFKGFNNAKKFNQRETSHPEVLSPKDEKNLRM